MRKRLLSALLAMAMVLTMLPVSAFATGEQPAAVELEPGFEADAKDANTKLEVDENDSSTWCDPNTMYVKIKNVAVGEKYQVTVTGPDNSATWTEPEFTVAEAAVTRGFSRVYFAFKQTPSDDGDHSLSTQDVAAGVYTFTVKRTATDGAISTLITSLTLEADSGNSGKFVVDSSKTSETTTIQFTGTGFEWDAEKANEVVGADPEDSSTHCDPNTMWARFTLDGVEENAYMITISHTNGGKFEEELTGKNGLDYFTFKTDEITGEPHSVFSQPIATGDYIFKLTPKNSSETVLAQTTLTLGKITLDPGAGAKMKDDAATVYYGKVGDKLDVSNFTAVKTDATTESKGWMKGSAAVTEATFAETDVTLTATFEAVPEKTATPATDTSTAELTDNQAEFTLTNTYGELAAEKSVKVYTKAAAEETYTEAAGVTGALDSATKKTLTLTFTQPPVEETTYYVTVTEKDKAESEKLALTVTVPDDAETYTIAVEGGTAEPASVSTKNEGNKLAANAEIVLTKAAGYKDKDPAELKVEMEKTEGDKVTKEDVTTNFKYEGGKVIVTAAGGFSVTGNLTISGIFEKDENQSKTYTATFKVTDKDNADKVISAPVIVVTYTDSEGKEQEVAAEEGVYTLTIGTVYSYKVTAAGYEEATGTVTEPTGDVTTVEVPVAMTAKTYAVTVKNRNEDKGTVTTDPADTAALANGTEVTITATPEAGNKVGSIVVNGAEVDPTVDGAGVATYTVTVDNADVAVDVSFVDENAEEHSITVPAAGEMPANVDEIAVSAEKAYTGATVTVTVKAAAGYEAVAKVTYKDKDNKDVEVEVKDGKFVMPDADVTVTAEATKKQYTVTLTQPAVGGKLSAVVGGKAMEEGQKIDHGTAVEITAAPAAGYELKELKINGEAVDVDTVSNKYTIASLEADTTVTAVFEKNAYDITVAPAQNGAVKVEGDKTSAAKETEVTFTAAPADNYKVGTVKVTTAEGEVDFTETAGGYQFTMPAADVTITVTFVEKATIVGVKVGELGDGINVSAELAEGKVILTGVITRAEDATQSSYEVPLIFTDSEGVIYPSVTAVLAYVDVDKAVTCQDGVKVTVDGVEKSFTVDAAGITVTPVKVKVESAVEEVKSEIVGDSTMSAEEKAEAAQKVSDALNTAAAPDLGATAEVQAIVDKAAEEYADKTDVTVTVKLAITATEYNPNASADSVPVLKLDITPKYEITYENADGTTETAESGELKTFDKPQTVEIPLPAGFVTAANVKFVTVKHSGALIPSNTTGNDTAGYVVTFESSSFSPFAIEVNTKSVNVTFTGIDGVVELNANSIANGYKLPVAEAEEGKEFKGWAITDGGSKKYDGGAALTETLLDSLIADAKDGALTLYPVFGDKSGNNTNPGFVGGGGGASGTTTYSVNVPTVEHGTVTVNPRNAAKDATVTITVSPNQGYSLGTLTVTDKDGNNVELTKVENNKYTFKMPASRVEIKATFVEGEAPATTFTDVQAGEYYYDAVLWAVDKGITTGLTETTFGPNASCTRAQMVTFLWRAAGSPEPTGTANFTDIDANEYYYKAVLWAVEKGITTGTTETTFSPNATVTRGQTVTFLYRYAGSPAAQGNNAFTDVEASEYYANAVTWAAANGITTGTTSSTFSPANNCTRGQIVTFLYRQMVK